MTRSSTLCRWSRLGLIALSAASLIASVPASADPRHFHGRYDGRYDHRHHSGSHNDSGAAVAALAVLGMIGIAALAASAQPSAAVAPYAPPSYAPPPYAPAPYPMTSSGQTFIQPPPAAAWSPPISADPIAPAYRTADGRTCQAYQSAASVDGYQRPVQGTACLERDGMWHVVN